MRIIGFRPYGKGDGFIIRIGARKSPGSDPESRGIVRNGADRLLSGRLIGQSAGFF